MSFFNKQKDGLFIDDKDSDSVFSDSVSPDTLTEEEILSPKKTVGEYNSNDALERLKKKMMHISEEDITEDVSHPEKAEDIKSSLLDKCMHYVIDEDGKDTSEDSEPLYQLQTVAEILKEQSAKSIESLSKKYDMIFEDLSIPKEPEKIVRTEKEEQNNEADNSKETVSKKIKNVQSNVTFVISDIDSTTITPSKDMSDTATITFTPVSADETSTKINVSTNTKQIDLTSELVKIPETVSEETELPHSLEKSEFEEYVPKNEINTEKDAVRIKRFYAVLRRDSFFTTFVSFLITGILSLGKIPFFSQFILSNPRNSMIVCCVLTFIAIVCNFKMFGSFKNIFTKKSETDVLPAITSILTIALSVIAIIKSFDILDMLLLLCIILSFRALCSFFKASYMLSNLKFATSLKQKRTVKLISDPAITFSMARNAIEGDALIATEQEVNRFSDIMKYSTYSVSLGGKLPIITAMSLILSAISGLASAVYFSGIVYGLYAATAIQCFACLPCLFFIDTLPLFSSSKKLTKSGAVILGKSGAEQIENANAFVISSSDIFPKGTVTLHKMQILSENSLDDTLIRAAALTEYTGNTLAPIFKSIAKSGNISVLPDTDTVKYEERLGISGWVDNRLLFIGNRTLMETHGIKVPSIDVDRKILSQGYFPVYVATREKACALLIIQYNVDPKIARELRKLTSIGVTMLVNNTDPNLTEEMLCDYIGLYEDSVKVMSSAGSYMYKNATVPVETVSAPAIFKKNHLALPSILNCATKIKRSNTLLTIIYIICACLGAIVFAYTSFGGSDELLSQTVTLLYSICATVFSYIIYLIERP